MKLRPSDIEAAFVRVVEGESVNRVARDFHVTEGALRWRFQRGGYDAREVRRVALLLRDAWMAFESLSELDRLKAGKLLNGAAPASYR